MSKHHNGTQHSASFGSSCPSCQEVDEPQGGGAAIEAAEESPSSAHGRLEENGGSNLDASASEHGSQLVESGQQILESPSSLLRKAQVPSKEQHALIQEAFQDLKEKARRMKDLLQSCTQMAKASSDKVCLIQTSISFNRMTA